jgi:hypothetical protein
VCPLLIQHRHRPQLLFLPLRQLLLTLLMPLLSFQL